MTIRVNVPQCAVNFARNDKEFKKFQSLTFKRRIKSRLPFVGIIKSSPYSTGFQNKG